jgi:hypothetical protein
VIALVAFLLSSLILGVEFTVAFERRWAGNRDRRTAAGRSRERMRAGAGECSAVRGLWLDGSDLLVRAWRARSWAVRGAWRAGPVGPARFSGALACIPLNAQPPGRRSAS